MGEGWQMADCKAYKVYFYHGDAKKQAVKLPKKWVAEKKVEAAIQLWTDGYNAKHPDATVDVSRVRFTEKNGTEIPRHKDIKTGCQDYQDILVVIDEEVVEEEVDPTLNQKISNLSRRLSCERKQQQKKLRQRFGIGNLTLLRMVQQLVLTSRASKSSMLWTTMIVHANTILDH